MKREFFRIKSNNISQAEKELMLKAFLVHCNTETSKRISDHIRCFQSRVGNFETGRPRLGMLCKDIYHGEVSWRLACFAFGFFYWYSVTWSSIKRKKVNWVLFLSFKPPATNGVYLMSKLRVGLDCGDRIKL